MKVGARVAEVVRRHEGPAPKSSDSDELSPNIRYFVRILRFVAINTHFLEIFGQKQCFLGKKCTITWYVLHMSRLPLIRNN